MYSFIEDRACPGAIVLIEFEEDAFSAPAIKEFLALAGAYNNGPDPPAIEVVAVGKMRTFKLKSKILHELTVSDLTIVAQAPIPPELVPEYPDKMLLP
jgi:hypothetical protein